MAIDTTTVTELTAEQVQSILVQPLEQASLFLASGPQIFDTPGRQVRVPKQAAPTAPSWFGENEAIGEVNPDFDEVVLLPDSMKSVKVLVKFSNELARQSVVSLDAALRARLVTDVAATLDAAFYGSTTTDGTKPLGLVNYTDRQKITAVGDVTVDALHDAEGLALAAHVNPAALRWTMAPALFVAIRKLKDAQDRYLVQPDVTAANGYTILGHPVDLTTYVGAGTIALHDPSQIAVARDMAPTVKVLDQTFGANDQMALRVVARYDAKPLNGKAVVTLEGVTAPAAV